MDSPEDPYIAPLASGELEINRVDLGKVGLKMEEMVPLDLSDEPRKPSRLRLFKCPVIGLKMLLLAEMSVVLFFNFASFSILATFFPNVALDRGADRTQIGLIFGAYPAIAFPASLVYGALIPLIGTEKLLLAGIFTNGITVVLFGFVPLATSARLFISMCFLLRVLAAIGGAACETTVRAIVLTEFSDNVGFSMGLLSTSTQLGFTVGPFLGGILYSLGGFMLPFAVIGGLLLALLFLVCYALPKQTADPSNLEKGPMTQALTIPGVLLMGMAINVNIIGLAFLDPTLAPHVFSIDPSMATAIVGLIFLISGLSAAALSPVVGTLCDKKGCFSESVIFGLVICGISLLLVGPSPAFNLFLPSAIWLVCIANVLNGASTAFVIAPSVSVMSDHVSAAGMPDDIATNGAVSGIVTAALNCGSFLGAFGGGVLNDWLSFSTAATVVAVLQFLQAVSIWLFNFFWRIKEKRRKSSQGYRAVNEQETIPQP